jgi:hypothetical protein
MDICGVLMFDECLCRNGMGKEGTEGRKDLAVEKEGGSTD